MSWAEPEALKVGGAEKVGLANGVVELLELGVPAEQLVRARAAAITAAMARVRTSPPTIRGRKQAESKNAPQSRGAFLDEPEVKLWLRRLASLRRNRSIVIFWAHVDSSPAVFFDCGIDGHRWRARVDRGAPGEIVTE